MLCLSNLSESHFATFSSCRLLRQQCSVKLQNPKCTWVTQTAATSFQSMLCQVSVFWIYWAQWARLTTWLSVQFEGTLGPRSKCCFSWKNIFVCIQPSPALGPKFFSYLPKLPNLILLRLTLDIMPWSLKSKTWTWYPNPNPLLVVELKSIYFCTFWRIKRVQSYFAYFEVVIWSGGNW